MEKTKKSTKKDRSCQKVLEEKDQKIGELTNDLQRLQAEFENFQKRNQRELMAFREYAKEEFIATLLPIVDNFELALGHECKDKEFHAGVDLIFAQLKEYLKSLGLQAMIVIGEKFDPTRHEALMSVDSDQPLNTIIEELQKGYTLNEKIIRTAKVKVSKGPKTQQ